MAFAILALATFTFWASSSSKAPMRTPVYKWTPPSEEKAPTKFTMAIVNPFYANDELMLHEPFQTFSKSLAADIEEAMTARGYSIRGPFKSRDEMVYNDKEVCDLAITIEIVPEFRRVQGKFSEYIFSKCADGSRPLKLNKAVVSISGKINLTAMEPLSGEKLWVKSVEIPLKQTDPVNSERALCSDQQILPYIFADSYIHNAVVKLLENGYEDIIDKVWNHMHPSEFERLKSTIRDLKEVRK